MSIEVSPCKHYAYCKCDRCGAPTSMRCGWYAAVRRAYSDGYRRREGKYLCARCLSGANKYMNPKHEMGKKEYQPWLFKRKW